MRGSLGRAAGAIWSIAVLGVVVAFGSTGAAPAPAGAERAGAATEIGRSLHQTVAAASFTTCAILTTTELRCWGDNSGGGAGFGRPDTIGDDETPVAAAPIDLGPGRHAVSVAAAAYHTCAVLDDGNVRCWGLNEQGSLGIGNGDRIGDDETPAAIAPVDLGGGHTATEVVTGSSHTCVILDDGSVKCWGDGGQGALGYGNTHTVGDDETPAAVGTVDLGAGHRAVAITAGLAHTCAILDDGSVKCWGANADGQLGYGTTDTIGDDETPAAVGTVDLGAGHRAVAIAAGYEHTCAILDDGSLRCWGYGTWGELGLPGTTQIGDDETPGSVPPVDLGEGRTAVAVATGAYHTCALLDTAALYCWGLGYEGQLGYGDTTAIGDTEAPTSGGPVDLGDGRTAIAVIAGWYQTCVTLDDGSVTCWGDNSLGQLGYASRDTMGDDETPASVGAIDLGGSVALPRTLDAPAAIRVRESTATHTTATVPITLSAAMPWPVTVNYTTADGTAIALVDYRPASGSVTIPAGDTAATIDVTVYGDHRVETAETLTVALSGPLPLSSPTVTVTIDDDDLEEYDTGYWMLGEDGTTHPFGAAHDYGHAIVPAGRHAVDIESTSGGLGYWVLLDDGSIQAFGDATDLGSIDTSSWTFGERATSLSSTPDSDGLWVFTTRGRVHTLGAAHAYGDMSATVLNGPVVDSVTTPTGHGYYMVASDGGVFCFGDAQFFGSTGNLRLNRPVQSLVPNATGSGYWLVASDGGVFAFSAPFRGSMGATRLNAPITGMVRRGSGYLMVATDGGAFDFSGTPFLGSLGGHPPTHAISAVTMVPEVVLCGGGVIRCVD